MAKLAKSLFEMFDFISISILLTLNIFSFDKTIQLKLFSTD